MSEPYRGTVRDAKTKKTLGYTSTTYGPTHRKPRKLGHFWRRYTFSHLPGAGTPGPWFVVEITGTRGSYLCDGKPLSDLAPSEWAGPIVRPFE